jgi:hypothetical protein
MNEHLDWHGAFLQVQGYVAEAEDDDGIIDPRLLSMYMQQLRRQVAASARKELENFIISKNN